jgi:hypothetical protein
MERWARRESPRSSQQAGSEAEGGKHIRKRGTMMKGNK